MIPSLHVHGYFLPCDVRAARGCSLASTVAPETSWSRPWIPWPVPWSQAMHLELDAGAHDEGAFAGELQVFGGVGGDPRCRDEPALAPAAHAGVFASDQLDARQEVRQLVGVERAFDVGLADQRQEGRDV